MTASPLPSNAEVAAALGAVFGDRVMLQGTTFEVAADVLRIIRIAIGTEGYWLRSATNDETVRWVEPRLAATQEPARFNGEQALAEWEAKHGGQK